MWGTAIAIGSTALAAPSIIDAADDLSQWSNKKKKEINRMNDAEFDDYRPGWFDRTFLGVDPTKIEGQRDSHIQSEAEQDGNYIANKSLVEQNGGTWSYTPGQTAQQAISANANNISQATQARTVTNTVTASNALDGTNKAVRERELAAAQRKLENTRWEDTNKLNNKRFDYTMKTNAQERLDARADAQQLRADNIRMQIRADERSDKRYNQQLAQLDRRDRKEAIGNAAAGLTALMAAFAV